MAIAWAQGTSVVYEHDARGRLVKATFTDGTIVNYSYDENGNRTGADVVRSRHILDFWGMAAFYARALKWLTTKTPQP